MNKISTVEEFYKQTTGCVMNHRDIKIAMIEFAKLHVEAALLAAEEEVDGGLSYVYPLENIK